MKALTIFLLSAALVLTMVTGCPAPVGTRNSDSSGDPSGDSSGDSQARKYPFFTDAAFVSPGKKHVLILKNDKTLWAVGNNDFGQLGAGKTPNQLIPVKVMDDIASVEAGDFYTMIVKSDGDSLWAVGANGFGQLGDGTTDDRLTPVAVMEELDTGSFSAITGVKQVSASDTHTMILKKNNDLLATGANDKGQLGDTAEISPNSPTLNPSMVRGNVKQVSTAAGGHTMTIKTQYNSLWGFGRNAEGQLGDGQSGDDANKDTSTPISATIIKIPDEGSAAINNADYVSAAYGYTMLLTDSTDSTDSNTVHFIGVLGRDEGPDGIKKSDAWEQVLTGVRQVSAANGHSMFVKTDDSLWGLGKNDKGQLGDGTTDDVTAKPKEIMKDVKSVYAGYKYTYFIKTNGSLWAVGANDKGQLGDGTTTDRLTPVQVQMNAK